MSFLRTLRGQTASWIQCLQEHSFTSEHHQGQKHNKSNALSWRPCQEWVHPLPQSRCAVRHQACTSYSSCSCSWLGSSHSENRTTEWPDTEPILEKVETGQHSEWKDIANRRPTYRSYRAQWKSLTVRNGTLGRNWESANGRSKIAQIILPWSRVNSVPNELHGGPS
jgi:hypothetical protein